MIGTSDESRSHLIGCYPHLAQPKHAVFPGMSAYQVIVRVNFWNQLRLGDQLGSSHLLKLLVQAVFCSCIRWHAPQTTNGQAQPEHCENCRKNAESRIPALRQGSVERFAR
jgi:hypothetical protein